MGSLAGLGMIAANGGNAHGDCGSGGGGRVAVYYGRSNGFNLDHITAYGGREGNSHKGAVGTVYLKPAGGLGELRIDSHGQSPDMWTPLGLSTDTAFVAERLVISGSNVWTQPEHQMPVQVAELVLQNGGMLSHLATTSTREYSLLLTITNNLVIDAASAIDVSASGYLPNRTIGNTNGGASTGWSGGSYGGLGYQYNGQSGWVYGDYHNPNELGSGGGGGGGPGSPGGGLVRIIAGSAQIDGAILANGGESGNYGEGSGGGIWLKVGSLAGSGIIAANGGNAHGNCGAGGGGRVAVYYGQLNGFDPDHITAYGGREGNSHRGAVGTVYLKPADGLGELRIDSHGQSPDMWTPLGLSTDTAFVAERLVISGTNVWAQPEHQMPVQLAELVLQNGGMLSHLAATDTQEYSLVLNIASNLTIDAASAIDVSASGYPGNRTVGSTSVGASTGWSGGSYGGQGFSLNGQSGAVYGDSRYPENLGSGGGGASGWRAGVGGGLVQITAARASIDGAILANGDPGGGGGGGSGGGIRLNVGSLTGTGRISANGAYGPSNSGGGGGGRIAVYTWVTNSLPATNVLASTSSDARRGQSGTVLISSSPLFFWAAAERTLFHDAQTLRWVGLGVDPDLVNVELIAHSGGVAYLINFGQPACGSVVWDTTKVPDGQYQITALFRDGNRQLLGEATRSVLINNSVVWHSGTIAGNETWSSNQIHLVDGLVNIRSNVVVTLQPGTVVKFAPKTSLQILAGGRLNALGSAQQTIVLTAIPDDTVGGDTNLDGENSVPQPGSWNGVVRDTGANLNDNQYVQFRYIKSLHSGTLTASETWPGSTLHQITGDVVVPGGLTLSIQPGAVLKFDAGKGLTVQAQAKIIAEGTVGLPIILTSSLDDTAGGDTNGDGNETQPSAGDWKWVLLDGGGGSFNHCQFRYGGGPVAGGWGPAGGPGKATLKTAGNASLIVSNSILRDSFYDGILSWGGPVTVANSVFSGIDRAVTAHPDSVVSVVNCTLDNNRVALLIHGGSLNVTNTIAINSGTAGILHDWGPDFLTIAASDVWNPNSASGNYSGTADQTGKNGNLSVNPKFKNAAQGNYRLNYGSPCIDAANGPSAPATDFMGAPRYMDPRSSHTGIKAANGAYADMGAFEFVETATSDIDLIALDVTGPAQVVAGNLATVSWKISNLGSGSVKGAWHDTILLVPDHPSSSDNQVTVAEIDSSGALGPGQQQSFSAQVRVPGATEGLWRWAVWANHRGEIFEGSNWTNNLAAAASATELKVPELKIGGPDRLVSFLAANQTQWFKLASPSGQDVMVVLRNLSNPTKSELFVGRGYVPTQDTYDLHQESASGATLAVSIPNPGSAACYLRVNAALSTNGQATFSLSASTAVFSLQQVLSAKRIGNSGPVTIRLQGGQLLESMAYQLVAPDGKVRTAKTVYRVSSSEVFATFDSSGSMPGNYSLQVADRGRTATLTNAVAVFPGQSGRVEANVTSPANLRPLREGKVRIEYRNVGDTDAVAPLMLLTVDNAMLRAPDHPDVTGRQVLLLGSSPIGPAGILSPGQSGSLELTFVTDVAPECNFSLWMADSPDFPMNWGNLKSLFRPPSYSAESWEAIWANFVGTAGASIGQFNAALADRATLLGRMGIQTVDAGRLLLFMLQQADQFGALSERYRLGAFGRGWMDFTDLAVVPQSPDQVLIRYGGVTSRRFHRQKDGSYLGLPSEHGVLTFENDHYQVREDNGLKLVFRADGRLDYIEDAYQQRISAVYTGNALTQLTTSNHEATVFAYNDQGRITTITDPVGRTISYVYDSSGEHLLKVITPDGRSVAYTYFAGQGAAREHALQSITYADGTRTYIEYDDQGGLLRVSGEGGAEAVNLTRDPLGMTAITYADGSKVSLLWDDQGILRQLVDPLGGALRFGLDAHNNIAEVAGPGGFQFTARYDAQDNLVTMINALSQRTDLAYDPLLGLPQNCRSPLGYEPQIEYDRNGHPLVLTYPDGQKVTLAYNQLGWTTNLTNARGQSIQYTYDNQGLLTRKDYGTGAWVALAYDAHRNLTNVIQYSNSKTQTNTYFYDGLDRLTKVIDSTGRSVQYDYDAQGRRARLATGDGKAINYRYDSQGCLFQVVDELGMTNVTYLYDLMGRLSRETLGNGVATIYQYNIAGQLTRLDTEAADGSLLSRLEYSYDEAGQPTRIASADETVDYGYDALGQLLSVTSSKGRSIRYVYDADGNRTVVTDNGAATYYLVNNLDQYVAIGQGACRYDADGNLISKTDGTSSWTYDYDAENRLIRATGPPGLWHYEYDPFGQMIAATHDGKRVEFLRDQMGEGEVLAEYSTDSPSATYYTHALGLVCRRSAGGAKAYYTFDGQGNTKHIIGDSGTILNQYAYLPFGELTASQEQTDNPYRFGGWYGLREAGAGLVSVGARFYDPAGGRFVSREPATLPFGNLYRYAFNNPLGIYDANGEAEDSRVIRARKALDTLKSGGGKSVKYAKKLYGLYKDSRFKELQTMSREIRQLNLLNDPRSQVVRARYESSMNEFAKVSNQFHKTIAKVEFGLKVVDTVSYGLTAYDSISKYRENKGSGDDAVHDAAMFAGKLVSYHPTFAWMGKFVETWDKATYYGSFGWTLWGYRDIFEQELQMKILLARKRGMSKTRIPMSWDPNDITGPAGYGEQSYIIQDLTMNYLIRFENKTNATASAQVVVITNTLSTTLDWSTFELGNIGFGAHLISVPAGRQNYTARANALDALGVYVDLQGQFNPTNGLATWTFTSIDPVTGGLPEDPLAGFLPPNTNAPAGEGWVRYSVKPRTNTTDGSQISARASIYFDVNPRIDTPTITNAVDSAYPASDVLALPATSPPNFTVSWTGQDGRGAGITGYDIFVATNQAPYGLWLQAKTNLSMPFTGVSGSTYSFYSIATDGVGHQELPPAAPDALTLIGTAPSQPPPTLLIRRAPSNRVVLSWSSSGGTYVLEAAGSLSATNRWQPVTDTPVIVGDSSYVTNGAATGTQFYRLRSN